MVKSHEEASVLTNSRTGFAHVNVNKSSEIVIPDATNSFINEEIFFVYLP